MNETEFKKRTKSVALRSIKLIESLPKGQTGTVLGKQLLRSATSVGANYRAVCRAKSTADMINKLKIVEEEADESMYWIELLTESGLIKADLVSDLKNEFDQIVAMVVSSQKTLRINRPDRKPRLAKPKQPPASLRQPNPQSIIENPK